VRRRDFSRLAALAASGILRAAEPTYGEKYRPQFHFSPKKGWTNDPNGLVFYKGEYHLFFQHNPFDVVWGNMTWGHAVSPDMVHWTQIENSLEPDKLGTMYSGSAVVDWNNTAGFQKGEEKTIVLIYTAAGGNNPESKGQPFTQCIAYSNDRGRTFTKYPGNPVVPNIAGGNRDPKVVWHAPTGQWIMTLFVEGNTYAFLSSPDLKHWTMLHKMTVPTVAECPDFFEMPVENEPGVSKWIWTGANATYVVGNFDGKRFVPEVLQQPLSRGTNYYAVQTYSDLPGNRRVQVAWMNGGKYPGMPFNQQMSCPVEFKLRKVGYGSYRLSALPIREIESLRGTPHTWKDLALRPEENPLAGISGDLWDIVAEIEVGGAKEVGFRLRGETVAYTVKDPARNSTLSNANFSAAMPMKAGRIRLRILVDRTSIEVFGNDGEMVIPRCFLPPDNQNGFEMYASGGEAKVVSLDLYPMRTAWGTA